jgi:2-polyprenyl-3-methyl-5-hydroxy-6-metoxy-1,4-benzoquinol methylase
MKSEYELIGKSYKSKVFGNPQEIYKDNYWSNPIRSTIDEQVFNVREKNRMVMDALTYINPKRNLEIGCSPAILLGKMSKDFTCVGIEVDIQYKEAMEKYSNGADLNFGFFPDMTIDWDSEQFSNIIALDVFEHIEDSKEFLKECNRLMLKDAHLILQSPTILEDGQMDEAMFNGLEHIWIYHIDDLKHLLYMNGFEVLKVERLKIGHEQITSKKI